MNGLDISGWQRGLNLDNIDYDFVICKSSQGTFMVEETCDGFVQKAIRSGKCFGVYHYIGGGDPIKEANYFINNVKGYIGKGILVLDWERYQNSAWGNEGYLDAMIKEVIRLTGVRPIIYCSLSSFPWNVCRENNCGTWVAQYANSSITGYQDHPWNENSYSCTIRQYTSSGRLNGWGGNLDLDKAYITKDQWAKYANPSGSINPLPNQEVNTADTIKLAIGVIAGKYGNGEERKNKLGSKYDDVQNLVNLVIYGSDDEVVEAVVAGKCGNGEDRKNLLCSRYDKIQEKVNNRYKKKSIDEIAKEVIRGEWYNGAARKNAITEAGYDYDAVQKRVNQMLS